MSLPSLLLLVAIASGLLAGVGTWRVQEWRHAAIERDRIEAAAEKARMDAKRVDGAAVAHESARERIRTEFLVITEKVEHVLKSDFYAAGQQCLDAGGLRELAAAVRPADAASQPARAMPAAGPAR